MNHKNTKIFDFEAHEAIVDKLVARQFSSGSMSNAKWRKLFLLLNAVAPEAQVIWKFVGSENDGVRHSLPPIESLEEAYLNNQFWFGPLYYKEIEWLEIPRLGKPYGKESYPSTHYPQDIDTIRNAIVESGAWDMEESTHCLKIYGYR